MVIPWVGSGPFVMLSIDTVAGGSSALPANAVPGDSAVRIATSTAMVSARGVRNLRPFLVDSHAHGMIRQGEVARKFPGNLLGERHDHVRYSVVMTTGERT